MSRQAFAAPEIFDGTRWHRDAALVVENGSVAAIAPRSGLGAIAVEALPGRIVPGLIDLQVNGAGGALFNLTPDVATIRTMAETWMRYGTTGLLPTLITDTPDKTDLALAAGIRAAREQVPGFLGLHLEGPHLAVSRKGAHDPALIRPMAESDVTRLLAAKPHLPVLKITVAAETVPPETIGRLVKGGIVVSIGHSDATYEQVIAAVAAGASLVTHLFNAQSQLTNREPGVVGAALDAGALHAGIIADGVHVHPATLAAALRAKRGPGRIFLVTDAMSITGTDWTSFELTGRRVLRKDGVLRLESGALAGADLTLPEAVRYVHRVLGLPLDEALRMASLYPAEAVGLAGRFGTLAPGQRADFAVLDESLAARATFITGTRVHPPVPSYSEEIAQG